MCALSLSVGLCPFQVRSVSSGRELIHIGDVSEEEGTDWRPIVEGAIFEQISDVIDGCFEVFEGIETSKISTLVGIIFGNIKKVSGRVRVDACLEKIPELSSLENLFHEGLVVDHLVVVIARVRQNNGSRSKDGNSKVGSCGHNQEKHHDYSHADVSEGGAGFEAHGEDQEDDYDHTDQEND